MPSEGFVKASSNNLPSVDMFMVMEFIKTDDRFNAAEFRNAKATAATAFLMWVHRRSEDPSSTDVTCYWAKPRLSAVGTSLKFIKATDFCAVKNKDAPATSISDSTLKEEIVNIGLTQKLDGQILKYASEEDQDKFYKLSIYKLLFNFHAEGGVEFEDFLLFASGHMSGQSDSPRWHEFSFGRITASKLHEFAHCTVAEGTLVEAVIGAYKLTDTKHMKRGRQLEKDVIRTASKQLKIKFRDCGLFMSSAYPLYGASPDALSSEFVVEVKCPISEKTLKNYIKDGQISLKHKCTYKCCARKKKRGIFCVAQPDYEETKNVQILYVDYDEIYLKSLIGKAAKNWMKFIFPKLYKCVS